MVRTGPVLAGVQCLVPPNIKNPPRFNHENKSYLLTRAVLETKLGRHMLQEKDIVIHQCDNPRCCEKKHLRKGTHSEMLTSPEYCMVDK